MNSGGKMAVLFTEGGAEAIWEADGCEQRGGIGLLYAARINNSSAAVSGFEVAAVVDMTL